MKIDFDELIYQITLRFDASITPAGGCGTIWYHRGKKKDINWLCGLFHGDLAQITKAPEFRISTLSVFEGLVLFLSQIEALYFLLMSCVNKFTFNQIGGDLSETYVEMVPMLKIYDEQIVYRFYEREKEEVAVIPGIESHWFYAPLWK